MPECRASGNSSGIKYQRFLSQEVAADASRMVLAWGACIDTGIHCDACKDSGLNQMQCQDAIAPASYMNDQQICS